MNRVRRPIALSLTLVSLVLLAGCATDVAQTAAADPASAEKQHPGIVMTGSRLPRKTTTEILKSAADARDAENYRPPNPGGTRGN
jgi:type IV pilus biogenesis protein CpaD/CtpE